MQAARREILVCLHNGIYWMYSIMVVRLLHTEQSGSSTLLTSTKMSLQHD